MKIFKRIAMLIALCAVAVQSFAQEQSARDWTHRANNPVRAQKLVNDLLQAHPEVVVCALHLTEPGTNQNAIIANLPCIAKPWDEDDAGVIESGKPRLAANKDQNRIRAVLPLLDNPGKTIGALAVLANYHAGDDTGKFLRKAIQIRDGLRQQIPSAASLYARK